MTTTTSKSHTESVAVRFGYAMLGISAISWLVLIVVVTLYSLLPNIKAHHSTFLTLGLVGLASGVFGYGLMRFGHVSRTAEMSRFQITLLGVTLLFVLLAVLTPSLSRGDATFASTLTSHFFALAGAALSALIGSAVPK